MSRLCSITMAVSMAALLPSAVRADTIQLTAGALVGDQFSVRMAASGDGLSIEAVGGRTGGIYGPAEQCGICLPGDPFTLFAHWVGDDFPGLVTANGDTFRVGFVGSEGLEGALSVLFDGSLELPPFTGESTETVFAPFSFTGSLSWPPALDPGRRVALTGHGTAAATFHWGPDWIPENSWSFRSIRYDFEPGAPVPEPASLLLLGTGLSGLAYRRWRRGRNGGDPLP